MAAPMDITPILGEDRQIIQGYGVGHFIINNARYESATLLTTAMADTKQWKTSTEALNEEEIVAFLAGKEIEILIIGTGKTQQFMPPSLRNQLRDQCGGVGIEVMDSGAACRTFNVLASEDRRVAAALQLV